MDSYYQFGNVSTVLYDLFFKTRRNSTDTFIDKIVTTWQMWRYHKILREYPDSLVCTNVDCRYVVKIP